jgi:hypothetical protein
MFIVTEYSENKSNMEKEKPMASSMNKSKARVALTVALDIERKARLEFGRAEVIAITGQSLGLERATVAASELAVEESINALVRACEEEVRAGIAAWIADAPARIAAQSAAGAVPLHYMHTIGQLAAAADLAEAIRNKVDLKEGR